MKLYSQFIFDGVDKLKANYLKHKVKSVCFEILIIVTIRIQIKIIKNDELEPAFF
jgi:hypothetical protein